MGREAKVDLIEWATLWKQYKYETGVIDNTIYTNNKESDYL